ncbi:MAG: indole-3-glycerol phosphate synthase TrpC [Pseudomonadota bacterium]|jgi:indole-3-glycerol phosphate synthase
MATVLDSIIAAKYREVAERRDLVPIKRLEKELYFSGQPVSLVSYLLRDDLVGIIAEIKRKSPSKGIIRQHISVEELSVGYMQAGASALSVLTDSQHFGGSSEDLMVARRCNFAPILRKDFIVDEYQIVESKAIGADVVLLIAAALPQEQCAALARCARSLGLEVLLEVHSEEELATHYNGDISLVGVNNRDLHTFNVSLECSERIIATIPEGVIAVAESGITSPEQVTELRKAGYRGFLIGEAFMRDAEPALSCKRFIERVEGYRHG